YARFIGDLPRPSENAVPLAAGHAGRPVWEPASKSRDGVLMRSIRTAALVAAAALLCSSYSGSTAKSQASSPTSAAATGMAAYYQQRIQWSPCNDGFQCGSIKVPLDYAHPGGT